MSRALRERIARLERQRDRRPFPRRVFGIYEHSEDEVFGVEADGVTVLRQPGEPLADLHLRAFAMTGALCLFSLYTARQSASEPNCGPSTCPTPADAPEAVAWPNVGDAGVGRVARRDELVRMGVIPVPPEHPMKR